VCHKYHNWAPRHYCANFIAEKILHSRKEYAKSDIDTVFSERSKPVDAEARKVSLLPSVVRTKKAHSASVGTKSELKSTYAEQSISSEIVAKVPLNSLHQDDTSQRARADLRQIYNELRKDFHSDTKENQSSTLEAKLAQGISSAQRKPGWNEAPIIEEISRNGEGAIYKVITGGMTYCVYYSSNHRADGIDTMARGIHSRVMNCPHSE